MNKKISRQNIVVKIWKYYNPHAPLVAIQHGAVTVGSSVKGLKKLKHRVTIYCINSTFLGLYIN
jgi:hypothetical protein